MDGTAAEPFFETSRKKVSFSTLEGGFGGFLVRPFSPMPTTSLLRRVTAEFVGTLFLVATVIGSGIMAERLAGTNVALALLANTIATGAILVALIFTFDGISGAHFNPAVTVADAMEGASGSLLTEGPRKSWDFVETSATYRQWRTKSRKCGSDLAL
jgi:hypothetical protein